MAKRAKPKMKAWRKAARQHNLDAGYKHQGRKHKGGFQLPPMLHPFTMALLNRDPAIALLNKARAQIHDTTKAVMDTAVDTKEQTE